MPNKTIYLSEADAKWWDQAQAIVKRRRSSMSKLIGSQMEDFVRNNSGDAAGLPIGFRVPDAMKDPVVAAREALADDFRANFLDWLKSRNVVES